MARFDINKKGYDTEQVDTFINKLSLKYEEKLSEQKDRVFAFYHLGMCNFSYSQWSETGWRSR